MRGQGRGSHTRRNTAHHRTSDLQQSPSLHAKAPCGLAHPRPCAKPPLSRSPQQPEKHLWPAPSPPPLPALPPPHKSTSAPTVQSHTICPPSALPLPTLIPFPCPCPIPPFHQTVGAMAISVRAGMVLAALLALLVSSATAQECVPTLTNTVCQQVVTSCSVVGCLGALTDTVCVNGCLNTFQIDQGVDARCWASCDAALEGEPFSHRFDQCVGVWKAVAISTLQPPNSPRPPLQRRTTGVPAGLHSERVLGPRLRCRANTIAHHAPDNSPDAIAPSRPQHRLDPDVFTRTLLKHVFSQASHNPTRIHYHVWVVP